ncbi:MAG: 4'-phosphopantetheinyl transferase superfamily protein [Bacteroidales bacterium]|nr:4'-phosphopantetheinyl transferase superfamily protein [Bacteroidales bacterium]
MEINILNIENISENIISEVSTKLPLRYQKALKFRFPKDYKLSIGASWLILKNFKNISESDIYINQYGKPFIINNDNFNISHSNNYVVFVKSKHTIGIDIEHITIKNTDISEKVYQHSEIEWLKKDFLTRFYTLWTQKESVMKATGQGFNLDPKTFNVLEFQNNKPITINNQNLFCKTIFYNNYAISLCSDFDFKEIELKEYN